MPEPTSPAPSRATRTPQLDASLITRYKANPAAFHRGTLLNLGVAILLWIFGILLLALSAVVGLASGGLAIVTMAVFPLLAGVTAFDEVRFRQALEAGKGVPPARRGTRA